MKFYCDSCQTKYSIADEKVRGKVLKVRCKKCGHVITVREPRRPAGHDAGARAPGQATKSQNQGGAPPPMPGQKRSVQWHYSINGQSFGPFEQEILAEKIAGGEIGDGAYLWNETFSDWKLVSDVPTFAEALATAHRVKAPPKTLGMSRAMKVIDRPAEEDDGPGLAGEQSTGDADRDDGDEDKGRSAKHATGGGEPVRDEAAETASTSLDDAAKELQDVARKTRGKGSSDRLAKLRQRLQLDGDDGANETVEPADKTVEQALDQQAPQDLEVPEADSGAAALRSQLTPEKETSQSEPAATMPVSDTADDDEDIAHAETLLDGAAGHLDESAGQSGSGPSQSVHDGLFSGLDDDEGAASGVPKADAAPAPSEDAEEEPSEDAVPFFPSAPKLGESADATERSATMSRVDEITGSLLIQINAIKKDGRKRAIFTALGAVATIALLAVGGYFAWNQVKDDEGPTEQTGGLATDHVGQRPEFHEYTQEELEAVRDRVVLEEAVVVSREDSRAALDREEQGGSAGDGARAESGSSVPRINADSLRYEDRQELSGTRVRDEAEEQEESRFSRPGMLGGGAGDEPRLAGTGGGSDDGDDRFQAMAAVQTDNQRGVYGDEYGELEPVELREGLSNSEIAQGIRSIMDSVGICRERHIYGGGGELTEGQITVSIAVSPEGRVGHYEISPTAIEDTHFGRCMNSHKRRWGFPRFKGDPVEIEAPFELQ